ncbi:hypothetical protein ACVIGV_006476 [Rhizobium leguminosarum]
MAQVLKFARNPNLPVLSNWVVNFDAFFDTGVPVLDSVLASELENLPGFTGITKAPSHGATCSADLRSACRAVRAWRSTSELYQ